MSTNAILVDGNGYVTTFRQFDGEAPVGWIDIGDQYVSFGPTMKRLMGGRVVDTGVSVVPPRPGMALDPVAGAWVDARTLDQRKADQWSVIKAARDAAEFGGFDWDGSRFDSDALSQQRIAGAVQIANLSPANFSIDWTLADNTVRTLDASQMTGVGVALAGHVNAQHAKARGLRQQIEAAQTEQEVDAVLW